MTRLFVLLTLVICSSAFAAKDPRMCGAPARGADGRILRSAGELARFRSIYPCPATKRNRGACPGWAIDHVIPLVCGGCDAVVNLQWLPVGTKSASGPLPKDRWERRIYCKAKTA